MPSCCKNGSQEKGSGAIVLVVLDPKPAEEAMLEAATATGLFGSGWHSWLAMTLISTKVISTTAIMAINFLALN